MNGKHLGDIAAPMLFFGGPYSNLQATRAMRTEAERLGFGPEDCICTGDTVAYCAQPEETVLEIRDWGCHVVMGNCEESLGLGKPDCGCGFDEDSVCALLSDDWYPRSLRKLSHHSRAWMRGLPRSIRLTLGDHRIQVLHGAASAINRFIHASTPADVIADELDQASAEIVIGGHCGLPFGRRVGARHWLNGGVIGMPANDGSTDGWFLLLEPDRHGIRARWRRLSYDHQAAHLAMQEAELDNGYADALLNGLWPSMDTLPAAERQLRGIRLDPSTLHMRR